MNLSIRAKVLLLAGLNLVLLAALAAVFLRIQLESSFDGFLATVGGARILAASQALSAELDATPPEGRDALLARYADRYGVGFHLFYNHGGQAAGAVVSLPGQVLRRLAPPGAPRRPGPRGGREGPDAGGPPPRGSGPPDAPPFVEIVDSRPRYWIGVRMAVPEPGGRPEPGTLLLTSDTLFSNAFLVPWRPWAALIALALALVLLCWLPFVHGMTGSLRRMTATTREMAEGKLEARVQTGRGDELGRLAESINRMGRQLGSFVQGQKRFLRDAAHEIRSPLGRMQIAVSILERDLELSKHEERLRDLREDVEAMTELTDQLLSFARSESQVEAVELRPVRIADVIHRAVKVERRDHPEIHVDVDPELVVAGDADMLFRCFSNLVRNAVLHGGIEKPISIDGSVTNGRVHIRVADQGPGVPEEDLHRLFSPFFRVEAARTRDTGGAGLGMAIVRTSVEACGGAVECRGNSPSGLVVNVTLNRA